MVLTLDERGNAVESEKQHDDRRGEKSGFAQVFHNQQHQKPNDGCADHRDCDQLEKRRQRHLDCVPCEKRENGIGGE